MQVFTSFLFHLLEVAAGSDYAHSHPHSSRCIAANSISHFFFLSGEQGLLIVTEPGAVYAMLSRIVLIRRNVVMARLARWESVV
jgi:hypothetical protein